MMGGTETTDKIKDDKSLLEIFATCQTNKTGVLPLLPDLT